MRMGCCEDGLVRLHMCDQVDDTGNRWVVLTAGVRGGGDRVLVKVVITAGGGCCQ